MASFRVEVDREIHKATRRLPGNIRQRVLRALKGLRDEPRPAGSEALDIGEFRRRASADTDGELAYRVRGRG